MTTDSSGYRNPTYPPTDSGSDTGTTDLARDQAGQVASSATDKAGQVAQTTKEQAQEVVSEATAQARHLTGELRSEATDQANTQLSRLVETLRTAGDDLEQMIQGGGANDSGMVADLAGQLRTHVRDITGYLDGKEPGDLFDDLQQYARRRPGAFLLGATIAGVVAGRLTRGAKAAASDSGSSVQIGGTPTGGLDPYATSVTPMYPPPTPPTGFVGSTTYDEPMSSGYPATGTADFPSGGTATGFDLDADLPYTGDDPVDPTGVDDPRTEDPYGTAGSSQGPRP